MTHIYEKGDAVVVNVHGNVRKGEVVAHPQKGNQMVYVRLYSPNLGRFELSVKAYHEKFVTPGKGAMPKKKSKLEAASLVVKQYIARPPEFLSVEVTRDNYDLVAEWLRCGKVITERRAGIVWSITFENIEAIDVRGKDTDKIKIEFSSPPEAVHHRRHFIIRDEQYRARWISLTTLASKYIEIPQEESIIA